VGLGRGRCADLRLRKWSIAAMKTAAAVIIRMRHASEGSALAAPFSDGHNRP